MKKTVLSHFYNEEYLLPWWLKHHKKYFDHGILIDYGSTDRSVEIIREICPTWEIVSSRNEFFDAVECDAEVKEHEARVEGWRICLNTTEFLYGNYKLLQEYDGHRSFFVPSFYFVSPGDDEGIDPEKPLHEQLYYGIHYAVDLMVRSLRGLHNFDDPFPGPGRHYRDFNLTSGDFVIFCYGFAPMNPQMIQRKLQIQHKVPPLDKERKLGIQHYRTPVTGGDEMKAEDLLYIWREEYLPKTFDLTEEINHYVKVSDESVQSK